jgi:hypothetical protein
MKRGMVDTGGCYAEPMAKRPDLTAYQRKIVDRYYEHKETIHATKLGELVSEIALTSDAKKLDKLWKSASEYLAMCGVELAIVEPVVAARDLKKLGAIAGAVMQGKKVTRYI